MAIAPWEARPVRALPPSGTPCSMSSPAHNQTTPRLHSQHGPSGQAWVSGCWRPWLLPTKSTRSPNNALCRGPTLSAPGFPRPAASNQGTPEPSLLPTAPLPIPQLPTTLMAAGPSLANSKSGQAARRCAMWGSPFLPHQLYHDTKADLASGGWRALLGRRSLHPLTHSIISSQGTRAGKCAPATGREMGKSWASGRAQPRLSRCCCVTLGSFLHSNDRETGFDDWSCTAPHPKKTPTQGLPQGSGQPGAGERQTRVSQGVQQPFSSHQGLSYTAPDQPTSRCAARSPWQQVQP